MLDSLTLNPKPRMVPGRSLGKVWEFSVELRALGLRLTRVACIDADHPLEKTNAKNPKL